VPEFLTLLPPQEALAKWRAHFRAVPVPETIATVDALGRVLAAPAIAAHPLPQFTRATVDGYAVRARDTHGAGESLPAYLTLAGEIPMGSAPPLELAPAHCALIHTGGMLPAGADAVVMVEHTQPARVGEIEILRPAAAGENVIRPGEDVQQGELVIPAGARLRPAEIGGLMALGITQVNVSRQPRVGILSSGDEVVSPESEPAPGQVRDVNTYTLAALIRQAGGEPVPYGILPDEAAAFAAAARRALAENDILLFTAGSSVSARDLTARTIASLGAPGILVHGVSVRPGQPTILAVCAGKPVIGLPGNPVSALVIAGLFAVPLIEKYLGMARRPQPAVPARLAVNLPSQAGREDWVPVRLLPNGDAEPIFGKSNLIFTLARADGLIRIPADATGLAAGAAVEVILMM
jgi:molybdopterin molybdotransferase